MSVIATGFDEPGKAQAEQTAAPAQAPPPVSRPLPPLPRLPLSAPAAPVTPPAAPGCGLPAPAEEDPFDSIF